MAVPASSLSDETAALPGLPPSPSAGRDHGFHQLAVRRVVSETDEAASIVLDVPDELRAAFAYEAGQFITFRVEVDGVAHHRCYSMSSTPGVDDELQVTVKRVPGGVVSNWLLDHVSAGATVEVSAPAGVFLLAPDERELVGFVAGSGITPVFSLVKAALAFTDRSVRLLYANRDAASVIFATELADLVRRHPGRIELVDHHDVESGFVDDAAITRFLGAAASSGDGYYLCGPTPFMDIVESALLAIGVDPSRIHIERFTPGGPETATPVEQEEVAAQVTIDLDGQTVTTEHRPGTTILQTARQAGLSPPYSCESGTCATCMGRLLEGTVEMRANDALTDDEVADGWVLTCQSVPTSSTVSVRYGYED